MIGFEPIFILLIQDVLPKNFINKISSVVRANDQNRTGDLIPTKDVLYQLSYMGNAVQYGHQKRQKDPKNPISSVKATGI